MALLDRRIVFAVALSAACSSPDFAASDADAGASGMTMGSAGAASRHASGGLGATSSAGGSTAASAGRSSATGGTSARGGSTSGSGDTSGNGDAAGKTATGGSNASTGGSSSAGGSSDTGGTVGTGGASHGGTGGSDDGGTSGGTDSAGGSGGSNQGGSGGDASSAGTGGGGTGGDAGSGTAGGGMAGLGAAGLGSGAGTGGTLPVAGAPNGGSGGVIGGCDNQLLANADFEAGPTSTWREETTWPGIEIIVAKNNSSLQTEGVAPYAGNYLAWLGGVPDNEWDHEFVVLRQDVTIPTDAATLTLSGRRYVKSVEDPSDIFDVAFLEFDDQAEDVVWQAEAWSNQNTTNGWVAFESSTSVENAWRGKKLTFVAYSNTDPDNKTSFFLDDLRLEASCGR